MCIAKEEAKQKKPSFAGAGRTSVAEQHGEERESRSVAGSCTPRSLAFPTSIDRSLCATNLRAGRSTTPYNYKQYPTALRHLRSLPFPYSTSSLSRSDPVALLDGPNVAWHHRRRFEKANLAATAACPQTISDNDIQVDC